jgi:hypothetical protein
MGVVPRSIAPDGYLDLDRDDIRDGDFIGKLEKDTLAAVEAQQARSVRATKVTVQGKL